MKKVLIITYCYPPCNAIAAQRPKSLAEHFSSYGLYPIVVTRHWEGNERVWTDYDRDNLTPLQIEKFETHTVIRIPYQASLHSLHKRLWKLVPLRKLVSLILACAGRLENHMDVYGNYGAVVDEYLSKTRVDYLFVTCPPDNSIRLGRKLSGKHNLPLIVEFRDLWNNELLSISHAPGFAERINDFLHAFHVARWLKGTRLLVSISEGILEKIQKMRPELQSTIVPNGFDSDVFKSFRPYSEVKNAKFTFSILGTLFPQHDLSVLTEGMDLFLRDKDLSQIQLNFIGTAGIAVVREFLEQHLPKECTRLTQRIPRSEALGIMESSDVLFHAGWRDYKGIASGKLFEYLGARRNVLIAPCDEDIMLRLITETGAGYPANSAEEFAAILNRWFLEWRQNGYLEYHGKDDKIEKYSRENEAATLAETILSLEQ